MKENLRKKLDSTIKKGRKEGFTLVELLVVIAIIAVLATVSVVGYMGFTKKAKVSNDISLTKQMNTALEANKAIKKNNTMSEAVADLEDAGLDVEKLSPTTNGYSYVWDSTSDMMFLLDEKKEVVAPSDKKLPDDKSGVFAILHKEADALDGYAQYLAADYPEQEIQYTVLTSVDTGKSGVKKVTVNATNSGSAIINMNGGTLDFTDGNADVAFYGMADAVDIKEVKDASFHVYGTVTSVKIAKGNVELESGSEVGSVVATDASAKFKKKDGAKLDGVAYTTDTRPAGIPEGATKVSSETLSLFAGGIGTETSPYLISTVEQFKNIIDSNQSSFKLLNDLSFKREDIANIDTSGDYYFVERFGGHLDGNNHNIFLPLNPTGDTSWNAIFNETIGLNVVIENLDIQISGVDSTEGRQSWFNIVSNVKSSITFKNLSFRNADEYPIVIKGNNYGLLASYVGFDCDSINVCVENCSNYARINTSAGGGTGLWFGSFELYPNKFSFKNANNYADIYAKAFGYFNGNQANMSYLEPMESTSFSLSEHVSVLNCYNKGRVFCEKEVYTLGYQKLTANGFTEWNDKVMNELGGSSQFIIIVDGGVKFSIDNSSSAITLSGKKQGYLYSIVYNTMYKGDNKAHGSFSLTLKDDSYAYKAKFASMKNRNLADTSAGNLKDYSKIYTSQDQTDTYSGYTIVSNGTDVYYVFNNLSISGCKNPYFDAKSNVSITAYEYNTDNNISAYSKIV